MYLALPPNPYVGIYYKAHILCLPELCFPVLDHSPESKDITAFVSLPKWLRSVFQPASWARTARKSLPSDSDSWSLVLHMEKPRK